MNHFLQKIGAWYTPALCEFIVWAPLRERVELMVWPDDQNETGLVHAFPMEKDEWGYWRTRTSVRLGAAYMFRLDGDRMYPDPASISQPWGVHGPSALTDRDQFGWEDGSWQGIPLGNMIIYELHTGTFSPTHDFEGVSQKLDYLLDLGINTIELMPLAQFPGDRNWGYDGVFPFAVQDSYGGAVGLKRLVDAAHRKGIAVIVDVVYNHLGPEGAYLSEYGPYFTDKYHTPWGMAINFDDAWSDGVRNFFLENATQWLAHFHIDGLRLDAVHAIYDRSASPFIRQLKERAIEIGEQSGSQKEIIAEVDLNDTRFIDPPEKGGCGLDGQWCDEFHHALHSLLTGERSGYYEDFGKIGHLEKAYRDTYVYNGNFSQHRKRFFGKQVGGHPYNRFVVFAQNHDQVGNREEGDRLASRLSVDQQKLAAAAVFLSPYIPLLFMGEEYGEKNPFLFFCSFSDPGLIERIRDGRKKEFRHANHLVSDPQDIGSFQRSMLSWACKEEPGAMLLDFYRSLIAFRKTRPALQGMSRDALFVHPAAGHTLCFERKILNDHVYIWLNFNGQEAFPENEESVHLKRVFDTSTCPACQADESDADNICPVIIEPGQSIRLSPYSAAVFEKKS